MSSFNDIQRPKLNLELGAIHPINHVKDFLIDLLQEYGFTEVDGPEIESEKFNFDMLNIKKTHPARQMHDTFYINNKTKVLRTHTSPIQIRSMLNSKLPLAITSAGKVFRKDDDATHLPMFHQVEGMYIDEQVTFSHLKDSIHKIIYAIFGQELQIRFRPSIFHLQNPQQKLIYSQIMANGLKFWDVEL